jgi:hypothetical protein
MLLYPTVVDAARRRSTQTLLSRTISGSNLRPRRQLLDRGREIRCHPDRRFGPDGRQRRSAPHLVIGADCSVQGAEIYWARAAIHAKLAYSVAFAFRHVDNGQIG